MSVPHQIADYRWTADGNQAASYLVRAQSTENYINVKSLGAAGDGVTDDTAAIASAFSAAATNGGTVFFPAGTYITGLQTLSSKTHILGSGIETTIIQLKTGSNSSLIQSQGFSGLTGTNSAGGIFNWSIQNITLDGNKAGNASSGTTGCLQVYGYGYILHNVRIRNHANEGIYSEWSSNAGSPGQDSFEANLSNFKVHDNGGDGIQWAGPHDSQWSNGIVYNNAARGIWVSANGNNTLCNNIHSWGASQTYAWYLDGNGVGCFNCLAEGASAAQVLINKNDCWFYGNIFAAGGATTGITLNSSVSGLLIQAKVLNCTTAAIALGSNDAGGNLFNFNCFASSGQVYTGTLGATSQIWFVSAGGVSQGNGQFIRNTLNTAAVTVGGILQTSFNSAKNLFAQTVAGGAITLNASGYDMVITTLSASMTSSSITNPTTGQTLTIGWKQGGAGSFTVVWPPTCKFAAGTAPTASTTSGFIDLVTFIYDGTQWNEISRSIGVH